MSEPKSLHLIPLDILPTAFIKAELLFKQVFMYIGILGDNVSSTPRDWDSFTDKLGVTVSFSFGQHLQTNRQVGRANQEIGHFLRTF